MEEVVSTPIEQQLSRLIERLRALLPELESLAAELRSKLRQIPTLPTDHYGPEYWRMRALCDAVVRVQIFVERNLTYIETLGVLALCRYTFELVVWLKHIERDDRFSLMYARRLMRQQTEFYDDLAAHLKWEISFYRNLGQEEQSLQSEAQTRLLEARGKTNNASAGANFAAQMQKATAEVDAQLAENFALYSDEIARMGYQYQAHLVESQALPTALSNSSECRASLAAFDSRWRNNVDELKVKEWKWSDRADYVGMSHEYAFIYSYTSRLLHATPASLTTDQKSLELQEVLIFLRYVAIQFEWIIKHARQRITAWDAH